MRRHADAEPEVGRAVLQRTVCLRLTTTCPACGLQLLQLGLGEVRRRVLAKDEVRAPRLVHVGPALLVRVELTLAQVTLRDLLAQPNVRHFYFSSLERLG